MHTSMPPKSGYIIYKLRYLRLIPGRHYFSSLVHDFRSCEPFITRDNRSHPFGDTIFHPCHHNCRKNHQRIQITQTVRKKYTQSYMNILMYNNQNNTLCQPGLAQKDSNLRDQHTLDQQGRSL